MLSKFKKSIFLFLSLYLIACNNNISTELKREEKFVLLYGSFENELNLFNLDTYYTRPDTQIFMKDGLFFIVNSGSQKILKLSSFGDLLAVIYNPESNIISQSASEAANSAQTATMTVLEYPFNTPGLLSITNSKQLFLVDAVTEDKIEHDHEENIILRDVILWFDENGNFIDYIGQEGLGGTPFPLIEGIYTTAYEDIVVVCRTQTGIKIYWYNIKGSLIYKIPVFFNSIPNPYGTEAKFFSSIDKIVPDFSEYKLYIKIDYYVEQKDTATNSHLGVSYDRSCLYSLNIQTGKYEKKIDIEPYEDIEDTERESLKFKKAYELLGITQSGWCYLTTPNNTGYALQILNLKSQKIYRKNLLVANSEMLYNTFHLSTKGIISALLAKEDSASVVWWRTDVLTGEK